MLVFILTLGVDRSSVLLMHPSSRPSLLAFAFLFHYTYRALVYPLLQRGSRPTPLSVWAMAATFCVWNGLIQVCL